MKIRKNDSAIKSQLAATVGVLLLIYQSGLIDGWIIPNMARLTETKNSTDSSLSLTLAEASWLVSCLKLGRFASVPLVLMFVEMLGSRRTIISTFIPVLLSWILTSIESTLCLYVARFFGGIAMGLTYGVYSLYLGEISIPTLRGTFNSIALLGWPLGALASSIAETYFNQLISCTICLLPCVLGMLLFVWLPESPYQLARNKDLSKARESLVWYRGAHNGTDLDMQEIVESTIGRSFRERAKQLVGSRSVLKTLLVVSVLSTYPQLCGVYNVMFYMQIILTNGKSHLLDPNDMVIYTNVVLLLANIFTLNFADKLGRRLVLVVSSFLMALALIALALHYYMIENTNVDPRRIEALPIAAIITLLIANSIGYSSTTSTLLGEMFPDGVKGIAATAVTLVSSLTGFVTVKTYQPLIDAIGETRVYFMYATIMLTAIPIVVLLLPETKGKSLQEIQKIIKER